MPRFYKSDFIKHRPEALKPGLNCIEILWRQTKYFWRHFVSLKKVDLLNEINSLLKGLGVAFRINLA